MAVCGAARSGSVRFGMDPHRTFCGAARLGGARHGSARLGGVRSGLLRRDVVESGEARQGTARYGVAVSGWARSGSVWSGSTLDVGCGEVGQGKQWRGAVRRGRAWHGKGAGMDWPVRIPQDCTCEWVYSERFGWWRKLYDPRCPHHDQVENPQRTFRGAVRHGLPRRDVARHDMA